MRYADVILATTENKKKAAAAQESVDATIAESARIHRETFRKYYLGENVVLVFNLNGGGLSFDANERMGFFAVKPNLKFTAAILMKAAEIAAEVEKWLKGERDDLPLSTWDKPVWNEVGRL